jgi:gamma-glutamyl-gamma-aminobutyrate hydrolase PuuD
MKIIKVAILLGIVLCAINAREDDLKPIVGIFTNPIPFDSDDTTISSVFFNYVAWLESLGCKVVPILYDYTSEQLDQLLPSLNGLLFQGGSRNLHLNGKFEINAQLAIDKATKLQKPIWFTCQGFELLHAILAQDVNVLEDSASWSINLPATLKVPVSSSNMFKFFGAEDIEILQSTPSTINYHNLQVSQESYTKWPQLAQILKITSVGYDINGKEFISSVESLDFNQSKFFAVQYHPEKVISKSEGEYKHSDFSTMIVSQRLGLGFLSELKKNRAISSMSDEDQLKWGLIISSEIGLKQEGTSYTYDSKNPDKKPVDVLDYGHHIQENVNSKRKFLTYYN